MPPLLVAVDTDAPDATVSADKDKLGINATTTVTVLFDEPVYGFANDGSDLIVVGLIGNFVGGNGSSTYTMTVTITEGIADIESSPAIINANQLTDLAGNSNDTISDALYDVDTTRPSVTITTSTTTLSVNETATLTFAWSEAVDDFDDVGDVTISTGTIDSHQTPVSYTHLTLPTILLV